MLLRKLIGTWDVATYAKIKLRMLIPEDKEMQVKLIFEKLKDKKKSRKLYELIGGWLLSGGSSTEKEKGLWNLFEEIFSYSAHPSKEAYKSYNKFARKYRLVARIPLRQHVIFKIAAVLIPIVLMAGGVFVFNNSADTNIVDAEKEPKVILPDASVIQLTEGSRIYYADNFSENRFVELKGEARFNVMKSKLPGGSFTVRTRCFEIVVLGTDFKVRSFATENVSTVELYHGRIKVKAGNRTIIMLPPQRLEYDHATNKANLTQLSLQEIVYEQMPNLVFYDASLRDVFDRLEKEYGVHIKVDGELPIEDLGIRGDFTKIKSIEELLNMLQTVSGNFTYEIAGNEVKVKINHIR